MAAVCIYNREPRTQDTQAGAGGEDCLSVDLRKIHEKQGTGKQ